MIESTTIGSMLCCPRCRGQISGANPHCLRCGAQYAREGSIIDFLGAGGVDSAAGVQVDQFAQRLIESPANFREALNRDGGDGDSLRDIARRIDLDQVLSDVNRILLEPEPVAPSPFFDFLARRAPIDAGSVVLDIGASCGHHLWELKGRSSCNMAALDINRIVLRIGSLVWDAAGSPISPTWIRGDALHLPFHDEAFTHVLSNVTLILLPFRAALIEFGRVLRRGGRMIFTVEGTGAWRKYWDNSRPWSRRRVNLLRQRLGNALLKAGIRWQDLPLVKRLSRHSQFEIATVERFVTRAGLAVEWCGVNKVYEGEPLVIGVVARKP